MSLFRLVCNVLWASFGSLCGVGLLLVTKDGVWFSVAEGLQKHSPYRSFLRALAHSALASAIFTCLGCLLLIAYWLYLWNRRPRRRPMIVE